MTDSANSEDWFEVFSEYARSEADEAWLPARKRWLGQAEEIAPQNYPARSAHQN